MVDQHIQSLSKGCLIGEGNTLRVTQYWMPLKQFLSISLLLHTAHRRTYTESIKCEEEHEYISMNEVEKIEEKQKSISVKLTGGSSPVPRTNMLTFIQPLAPELVSSGSLSKSHFLITAWPKIKQPNSPNKTHFTKGKFHSVKANYLKKLSCLRSQYLHSDETSSTAKN